MKTRSRILVQLALTMICALVLTITCEGIAFSEGEDELTAAPSGAVIPMAQSMSFSGAATQLIPIVTPPGRRGIGPNLSLTYNSYQKNGWIGVGWNLEMGAIQRATRRGVDYDAFDFVACFDGSTSDLVLRSEWGMNTFGAKIEGAFTRYYNENPGSNGWVVTSKDGNKYYYGTDATSRQFDPGDSSHIFKWCLDKVEDTNGNYMSLSYTKDQGEIYLSRIDYTGNSKTGMGTAYRVLFHLGARDDAPARFTTHFPVATARRLETIEVWHRDENGTDAMVGKYELTYDTDLDTPEKDYSPLTGRSLLGSVQRFGRNGNPLPPVILSYQEGKKELHDLSDSWGSSAGSYGHWTHPDAVIRTRAMDVDGDRRQDIVLGPDAGGNWYVIRATEAGFVDDGAWILGAYGDWASPDSVRRTRVMDVTGDGLQDIVLGPDTAGNWYVLRSTGSGFVNDGAWITGKHGHWTHPEAVIRTRSMDVNGDGLQDIVLGPDAGGNWYVLRSTGSRFVDDGAWVLGAYADWASPDSVRRTRVMDVTGDGLNDIVLGPDTGGNWYVLRSTGSRFVDDGSWLTSGYGHWTHPEAVIRTRSMDANGDGLQDILMGPDSAGNWYIIRSTGSGFVDDGSWITSDYGHWEYPGAVIRTRPMDLNGDGMQDILLGPDAAGRWHVLRSTGCRFIDEGFWISGAYAGWEDSESVKRTRLMDINGDGLQDIVLGPDTAGKWYVLQTGGQAPERPDLLNKVANGFGGGTEIEYTPSAQYPNADHARLPFVVQTASAITIKDGLGNAYTTNYTFTGGKYNFEHRDLRGFNRAVRINPDGTRVETLFHQDDEYLKSLQRSVKTFLENATTPFSATEFDWIKQTPAGADANACQFVALEKKTSRYTDANTVTRIESCTYDPACGGLTRKEVTDDPAQPTLTVVTERDWVNKGGAEGWMWRLQEERLKDASGPANIRKTTYTYDDNLYPGTGNLTSKAYWQYYLDPDGSNEERTLTETFRYDAYGNENGGVEAGLDLRGNAKPIIVFDALTKTYPFTITNNQNHVVEKHYDYGYGKVIEEKDPNGNSVFYSYDEFGRVIRVDSPDTGQTLTEYFTDNVAPNYVKTSIVEPDGFIVSYQFFDGLGRAIQSLAPGEVVNQHTVTRKTYDHMGRVEFVHGPYFSTDPVSSSPTGWQMTPASDEYPVTQTTYDARGRVETLVSYHTSGGQKRSNTVTYTYDGLETTVEDPDGKLKTEVRDGLGRVVQVIEAGNLVTTYAYNTAGDLLRVTGPGTPANITTNAYDTLGRKRYMNDPDMGVWRYSYDGNGNLICQTDANGNRIVFHYDGLDRVTRKEYPDTADLDVYYTYGEAQVGVNAVGRLYKVTKSDGELQVAAETIYDEYDPVGRTARVTRRITGIADQTTSYAYDIAGRLEKITYPDGFEVHHSYWDGSALLYQVTSQADSAGSDPRTHATISEYTASGKIRRIDDGSDTVTTYTYENYAERLIGILTRINSGPTLQQKSYEYSQAGNIVSITDHLKNTTYTYGYDDLHRLVSETRTGAAETFRPAFILPSYDGAGPAHAVKSATVKEKGYAYSYDDNGNMTVGHDFTDPGHVARREFTYNADNKPTRIDHATHGVTEYVYDGEGNRVKKVVNGSRETYYVNGLFEIRNNSSVKYIFAGNLRIAMVDDTGTYYYQKDHLGSTAAVTRYTGEAGVVHEDNLAGYLPFGGQRGESSITNSPYAFTDQERDPESGLYNYNARLYDPVVGMFVTPDAIVQAPFDPQALNRYSYCRNNPLVYIDPSGYSWFSDAVSKVMDDWLGIERIEIGFFAVIGGEIAFDFRDGVEISRAGVGFGVGLYANVSTPSIDIGGGLGMWSTIGYDANMGLYHSRSGAVGIVGYSGTYYFEHGIYAVSAGLSYKAASLSVGYSNAGGWSVRPGLMGVRYDSGTGRIGINVNFMDLVDTYNQGVESREYNGYGAENGNRTFNFIVDTIGTVAAGWEAADRHDAGYGERGASKSAVDFKFFTGMVKGSLTNLQFKTNGFVKAGVGLAISPIYYSAVAFGGGSAFRDAQDKLSP